MHAPYWFQRLPITVLTVIALQSSYSRGVAADSIIAADAQFPANVFAPADATHPTNESHEAPESKGPSKTDGKASVKTFPVIIREADGFDIISAPLFETDGSPLLLEAKRGLQQAQIHLKSGSTEHGNLQEFSRALESLDVTTKRIRLAKSPHEDVLLRSVEGLKSELILARSAARATFFGRFPLVRAFGIWPEEEEEFEVHSYTREGEAVRRAVFHALNQLAKSASTDPLHVLILVPGTSVNERTSGSLAGIVDSQAREAFANVASLSIYPGSLRAAVDPMPSWNSPDSAFDSICRQFLRQIDDAKEPRSVMLVMVREFQDQRSDNHWIQVQQRTYEAATLAKADGKPESLEADKVKVFDSLSHDRSRFNVILWIVVTLSLVVAIITHRGLLAAANFSGGDWQRWLGVPTAGFAIGLGLTPFIMLAMKRWLPAPQSDAIGAAWWPAIAGALSLVLPAGVFRLGAGTAGRYLPGFSCHGRWGIAFVPVAIGVSAAWTGPTCYAFGLHAVYVVLMLAIAASLIVYCFGRAVDVADEFPIALTPITVALSLLFGLGAFVGSGTFLAMVIGLAALITAIHIFLIWRTAPDLTPADSTVAVADVNPEAPRTIEQLRIALKAPRYQPSRAFRRLKSAIVEAQHKQLHLIGFVGPAAVGKTAAAQHLIDEIHSQKPDLQIMVGRCTEGSPPYQPFREALAALGAAAGIIASNSQAGEVNTIFERLADEFIPFWDFFSVDSDDEGHETSRHDLLEGVINVLRKLTQNRGAILFLDDVQWIDEGSAALLKHLSENFVFQSDHVLTIILASREASALEELNLQGSILTLDPPTEPEQVHFLQSSFGIELASAKHIVKALGIMSQEAGSIFWLIRAVNELVEEKALSASPTGIKLSPSYLLDKQLPVPQAMRAKLGAALRASGQYLPVLECAALLGEKFRVTDLAECLGMDRLLLLQILRHLEQELQLVRDVVNDQDCYTFSSEFMLEMVREELGVGGTLSRQARTTSKIARELHARIATVLERRTPRTPQLVCDLAHHYHAAGTAYASQCVDFCLAAAETARRQLAFQAARKYLALADESARLKHRSAELLEQRKLIEADEARTALKTGQVPLSVLNKVRENEKVIAPSGRSMEASIGP